jgi:hypothetical protein
VCSGVSCVGRPNAWVEGGTSGPRHDIGVKSCCSTLMQLLHSKYCTYWLLIEPCTSFSPGNPCQSVTSLPPSIAVPTPFVSPLLEPLLQMEPCKAPYCRKEQQFASFPLSKERQSIFPIYCTVHWFWQPWDSVICPPPDVCCPSSHHILETHPPD